MINIATLVRITRAHNILLAVDNTFASPVSQKPLALGADIVVHSATEYIGGHSDVVSGLVVTKDESIGKEILFIQNASGADYEVARQQQKYFGGVVSFRLKNDTSTEAARVVTNTKLFKLAGSFGWHQKSDRTTRCT